MEPNSHLGLVIVSIAASAFIIVLLFLIVFLLDERKRLIELANRQKHMLSAFKASEQLEAIKNWNVPTYD